MSNTAGGGADLRGASLRGASLRHAGLRYANLSGASLRGADLSRADLRNAGLSGAVLRGAVLRGADLRNADLSRADLSGADLRGVCLRGARINWQSHDLIAELLLQGAGEDIERRKLAGLVLVSRNWCWDEFLDLADPQRDWALDVLRKYVTKDDGAPKILAGEEGGEL